MKRLVLLCLCLVPAFAVFAQKTLPDVTVLDAKGKSVSCRDVIPQGKPVVLSFWDTACKPCIQELCALADAYDDWQEEFPFEVVAVSTDDARSSSKAVPLAKGKGWPFVVVLDRNGDFKRAMNVQNNPSVFVLDKDGKVVFSHVGYNPGGEQKIYEVLKSLR